MTEETHANAKSRSKKATGTVIERESRTSVLVEVELKRWQTISPDLRQQELEFINIRFHELLNEIYQSANLCVDRHKTFSENHTFWRRTVIVATCAVAITNLFAASKDVKSLMGGVISLLAAALAIVLTMLASLENFHNFAEKAQGYRESREFFLDAARDFDRRWDVYVRPFINDAEACFNAAELYRQLVARDNELRAKFKELTRTEGKGSKKQ
jgi:hypothetical protein